MGLKSSTALASLDLGSNDLSGSVLEHIAPLLRSRELKELSLSRNRLSQKFVEELVPLFGKNEVRLEKLDFSFNELTHAAASLLFKALKRNQYLGRLSLEGNKLFGGDLEELCFLL